MKKPTTLKQIAEKSGVSIGTVDRVIHNRGRVSAETSIRVRKVMDELGYRTNFFARALSLARHFRFGVLIPDCSNSVYYWDLLQEGIEKAHRQLSGFNIDVTILRYHNSSSSAFNEKMQELLSKQSQFDGFIISPLLKNDSSDLFARMSSDKPLVFIDTHDSKAPAVSTIGQDAFKSGQLAARLMKVHLYNTGMVGIIRWIPCNETIMSRIEGFQAYFDGSNTIEIKIFDSDRERNVTAFHDTTAAMLKSYPKISGIFVPSDCSNEVARCVEENVSDHKIVIIGYDLTKGNVDCLNRDCIDVLISQRPETQGYQAVYSLYQHVVLNEKVDPIQMMPIDVITKENVDYI